jgi:hypothetical protein
MQPHLHTGFVTFAYVTLAAIVGLNLVRFAAAKLTEHESTATFGKSVGALVTFA